MKQAANIRMVGLLTLGCLVLIKVAGAEIDLEARYEPAEIDPDKRTVRRAATPPSGSRPLRFKKFQDDKVKKIEAEKKRQKDQESNNTVSTLLNFFTSGVQSNFFDISKKSKSYFDKRRATRNFQKNSGDTQLGTTLEDAFRENSMAWFGVPNSSEKVAQWIGLRRNEIENYPGEEYPIYVAAAQGGGLYASYYAAMALARIQDTCPQFANHLFAISSVSGGSIGAQIFASLVSLDGQDRKTVSKGAVCDSGRAEGKFTGNTRDFFYSDLQTPLLGALLFGDLPTVLLPRWFVNSNRAHALERTFEDAWLRLGNPDPKAKSKSSIADADKLFFSDAVSAKHTAPAVVVGSTLANNGMPVVLSPFYFSNFFTTDTLNSEKDSHFFRFAHFFDLVQGTDLRVSTAMSLGARFPYVTPGGRLPARTDLAKTLFETENFKFADGGYFDNTGIAVALTIRNLIKQELASEEEWKEYDKIRDKVSVKLIRMIGPATPGFGTLSKAPNELLMPLSTLYSSRVFKRDYFDKIIPELDTFDLRFDPSEADAPLAWQLSRGTRKVIDDSIDQDTRKHGSGFDALIKSLQATDNP